jgi:hypothetical protein
LGPVHSAPTYSWCIASIGDNRAARNAGYRPKTDPIATDAPIAVTTVLADNQARIGAFATGRMMAVIASAAATPSPMPSVERIVRSGFVRSVSNPTETEVVRMALTLP